MTWDEFETFFDKYDEEHLRFENVQNKLSNRKDLHAFMLLDKLSPEGNEILAGAEHDEVYLNVDVSELVGVITEEQILELVRCGVRYDSENESLCMFA